MPVPTVTAVAWGVDRRLLRYRFAAGEAFTLAVTARERIDVDGHALVDVALSLELACLVRAVDDGVADIGAAMRGLSIDGSVPGDRIPATAELEGAELRIRKGVDGTFASAEGPAVIEAVGGGLELVNLLRWFAPSFAPVPVAIGDTWEATDRWTLRADRSPLGLRVPLEPVVDVRYGYRVDADHGGRVHLDATVGFSGGGRSSDAGLEVHIGGSGSGEVVVDTRREKLDRCRRQAVLDIVPRPVGAWAPSLPPMRVRRSCEAVFASTDASSAW